MSNLRIALEIGPKGQRVAVFSPEWPGLERGAKTEDEAFDRLLDYVPRYARVAELAGLSSLFPSDPELIVSERYPGTKSTDFWGISFAFSAFDQQPMTDEELDRELMVLRGCWAFFDEVRNRVSPELQKGPRGGGKNRDQIVRHAIVAEQEWARKLRIDIPPEAISDDTILAKYRGDFCSAITNLHSEGKPAKSWPLRFLIRHAAYHTMDHSWELEDKDLTPKL